MTDWHPIHTAPRDGSDLILFSPDAARPQVLIGYFAEWEDGSSNWADTWTNKHIDAEPTHWMGLPSAPIILPMVA